MQFLIQDHYTHTSRPVADPGFPRRGGGWGGANFQGGGVNLLFNQTFPKNCMKIKEFGPRGEGGHASLAFCLCLHECNDPELETVYEQAPKTGLIQNISVGREKGFEKREIESD